MSGAIPWLGKVGQSPWASAGLQAFGSIQQGRDQSQSLAYNAASMRQQADITSAQGYEEEARQRQVGAEAAGRSVAAAGQAGAGYGGSTGDVIRQGAVNAELDARSIRYKAAIGRWGYMAQADNLDREAKTARRSGLLKAGAALLQGYGNYANAGV